MNDVDTIIKDIYCDDEEALAIIDSMFEKGKINNVYGGKIIEFDQKLCSIVWSKRHVFSGVIRSDEISSIHIKDGYCLNCSAYKRYLITDNEKVIDVVLRYAELKHDGKNKVSVTKSVAMSTVKSSIEKALLYLYNAEYYNSSYQKVKLSNSDAIKLLNRVYNNAKIEDSIFKTLYNPIESEMGKIWHNYIISGKIKNIASLKTTKSLSEEELLDCFKLAIKNVITIIELNSAML